ncbi:MAG: serine endoprotease DegQ [Rickettsiales bacterium]|nr:serine endoprotease DegQ [Rickettsiales bacterium]|tara:strand:- start:824 stop:2176 length:1353 start_codon:yes stop_codon:yes gene_type:complete
MLLQTLYRFCFLILFITLGLSPIFGNSIDTLVKTSESFQMVASHATKAVVSISTVTTVQRNPYSSFYGFNYYNPYTNQEREGLGSGVIATKHGHILTNHHVVEKADKITVTLSDGREFDATLVGTDKKTDIAVLQIKAKNLPIIHFADSDQLSVGEWAIAIGNPFGLAGTVTAGIVSATGRSGVLDVDNYADFIQTDAAINPGNSGGALLNIHGKLIGINTAIFSQSGGYMGIGFAVPINMAKRVMEDIVSYGRVKRGMLGVTIKPVTDTLVRDLRLPTKEGAYVLEVKPGSSADVAGIKPGDLIIELGGKKVADYLALRTRISELKLNESSYCVVIRNKKKKRLNFTLFSDYESFAGSMDPLGLSVTKLDTNHRRDFNIPKHISGLLITEVQKGSIATHYRLVPGQVITKINNRDIRSLDDYRRIVESSNMFLFTVYEQGYEFNLVVRR